MRLSVRSDETVGDFKARLHAHLLEGAEDTAPDARNKWKDRGLPAERQLIYYRGGRLQDDMHFQGAGVQPNSFLQIFVRNP